MLDRSARKAAAVSLATGALIGVWQVWVDLLDPNEGGDTARVAGIIFLLCLSAGILIWGFWPKKRVRINRKLEFVLRQSTTPERVKFELRSQVDLRGKAIQISCNAPIYSSDFSSMHLVKRATYRMTRGSHGAYEESGTFRMVRVGDLIELTPAEAEKMKDRVELVNQRSGKIEPVLDRSANPSDIIKVDQRTVIFDFRSADFSEPFTIIHGSLGSAGPIEITSIEWVEPRKLRRRSE